MGCSRKLMSSQFYVMLRLLLLFSLTVASSMSFVAVLACSKHLIDTRNAVMVQWKLASQPRSLSYREYLKLKARYEELQRTQRNLLGEDLGPLNSKELEQLEHQLESSLKHVRSTKTQYMLDQLSELQNKEQMLMETNRALSIKLEEVSARNQFRVSWEGGEQSVAFTNQQAQSMGLFQPLECNPTLQIGYCNPVASDQMAATTHAQQVNGFIPGWML
uniref:K-box domain-containing protein n=1 Tax=Gossypium raimondii TaxID=29730 RepID=A0A0D2NCA0_GOSRA|nr:hypothetical protein B456_001G207300 [Gossypium raimondii]